MVSLDDVSRTSEPVRGRRRWTTRPRRAVGVLTALVAFAAGGGLGAAVTADRGGSAPAAAATGEARSLTDALRGSRGAARAGDVPDSLAPGTAAPTTGAGADGVPPTPTTAPPAGDAADPDLTEADLASGLLAAGVPESASGDLVVVPGSDPGPGVGDVLTVRVEVEDGLAVDPEAFAAFVMTTLNDPRGWGGDGSLSFARSDRPADLRVVLASPTLVDRMCAPLQTRGQVSCGRGGHATLNFRRWVEAVEDYGTDRDSYRRYLVNHEVGHLLGHPHATCPGAGRRAPVMQQQSYGVGACTPNPWPFPGRDG